MATTAIGRDIGRHTGDAVAETDAWRGFTGTTWRGRIDVRDFVAANFTLYEGDESFLSGPTDRTTRLWESLGPLFARERERGILDVDVHTPSTITSHRPATRTSRSASRGTRSTSSG
jgi:formate C-acetyltransferase